MTNHENAPRQKLSLSPEALSVVDGVATAMAALQEQLDQIPTLTESQLPEVYAGLRVLRAQWAMPPHTTAHDVETVPSLLNSLAAHVATKHTGRYLRARNALATVGAPVSEKTDRLVVDAQSIRETLALGYARQEICSEDIASADPMYRGLIRSIIGE